MANSIEERLRNHAQAFDGLLSLIPAKYYYGEDTSNQWQRKKQTKEEARKAKRAKLDPDASKTAKDVMVENARKRKRGEEGESDSDNDDGDVELDNKAPTEGLIGGQNELKKQKKADKAEGGQAKDKDENSEALKKRQAQKAEKKAAKREQKKLKVAAKLEKKQKAAKWSTEEASKVNEKREGLKQQKQQEVVPNADNDDEVDEDITPIEGFSALQDEDNAEPASSASSSPGPNSQPLDPSNPPSGSPSISSIVPPVSPFSNSKAETKTIPQTETTQPPTKKPTNLTPEELKQRLQKRIEELRAARHADGFNGKPARNRQELIEARRHREEQRKAHKKEMRQKAREEEQRKRDEAIARRFSPRGSGSLLASPGSPADSISSIPNNFSFGRVVFADGQQADPTLSTLLDEKKRKGPQDAQTALKALEAKKARLAGLDEKKRAEIEEKDMWLKAKKKAHGEKVKDDVSLLKKTLNRKTGMKRKSEKEWKERIEGVVKGKEMRQKKRVENLRKRREEKGSKVGKKKGKGSVKKRPGFEGGFNAKK
ncbi:uncharacterized protein PADG_08215 [Paracoccidioides brasiliensis Pb18]|uniref:Ribosomal RNA-processing protein 14/surfeit locus protein 6 C-terminal domain-containing protein n=1 Tax=Paracoccidioides brasiliensis (strain Pb18) TaxID=502780 RepID=C1GMC9_PARBD|nr:uncharacterized protein PADG_08215 [Paracoccidioides brasiliensis Pb18]EEH43595.1 hypothetical protein PADG_08215 [Paracoccidioides brasiliensis Pb18]